MKMRTVMMIILATGALAFTGCDRQPSKPDAQLEFRGYRLGMSLPDVRSNLKKRTGSAERFACSPQDSACVVREREGAASFTFANGALIQADFNIDPVLSDAEQALQEKFGPAKTESASGSRFLTWRDGDDRLQLFVSGKGASVTLESDSKFSEYVKRHPAKPDI